MALRCAAAALALVAAARAVAVGPLSDDGTLVQTSNGPVQG
jgi:para-nitrobenzyl esterase